MPATALDDFRAAIGGVKNTAAPQASGRREINWDGVKLDGTDVNPNTQVVDQNHTVVIPVDRFQNQGALFEDPYAVSGDGFASVNPASAGQFPAFSPKNTFVMQDQTPYQFDDRFIGQSFTIPGTATSAGTRGFGAIFVDVEKPGSSIEYFGHDTSGQEISLGTFAVPTGASGEPQFLGVLFDNAVVTGGSNTATILLRSFGQRRLARILSISSVITTTLLLECRSTPQNLISASLNKLQSSHLAFYSTAACGGEAG